MKTLAAFTAAFLLMTVLGFTAYFDDPNPWGGWFVAIWFLTLAGAGISLSVVGIARALSEIVNPRR